MKKAYIKPYTEIIFLHTESLMQALSPNVDADEVTVNGDINNYDPNIGVENNGNIGGVVFSKGTPLWDNDEW